jgi:hypothetical protein
MSVYELYYNTIYVIESLSDQERKTGTDLYNRIIKPRLLNQVGLFSFFISVSNKREFIEALEFIVADCSKNARGPLLHIECHGSEDGLLMASRELVTWAEMKPFLIYLNIQSRLNLLVVLAACSGANLLRTLDPREPAPVWGIVGPKYRISDVELFDDFSAFYSEIITSLNGWRAIEKLNGGSIGPNWRYLFTSAELFFKQLYQVYVTDFGNEKVLRKREDSIIARIAAHRLIIAEEEPAIRSGLRKKLRDHETPFNVYKRAFFFIDLMPENEDRFPINYSDVATSAV